MNDRPGAEKFHEDHKQMCEICRGLDEALVEAHARLSDRVAENERLRAESDMHQRARTHLTELASKKERRAETAEAENERLRQHNARLVRELMAYDPAWHEEMEPRCQGCEDAPLGQHTGPHGDIARNALAEEVIAEDISP